MEWRTRDQRMAPGNKRIFYALVSLILVAGGIAFLMVRGMALHRSGWTGMTFGVVRGWPRGMGEHLDFYLGYITFKWVLGSRPGEVYEVIPETPAYRAGLRPGDRILELEGIPLSNLEELKKFSAALRRGQEFTIRFRHRDSERRTVLRLASPFRSRTFLAHLVSGLATFLGFFLMGLYVIWKRPRDRAARVFFYLCMAGAAAFYLGPARVMLQHPLGMAARRVAYVVPFMVYLTLITLFLHFVLVFPRPRPWLQKWPHAVKLIYFPLFVSIFFRLLTAIFKTVPGWVVPVVITITGLALLVYPVWGILTALRSYREGTAEEKRQIRWPLWGISVTLLLTWVLPLALLVIFSLLGGPHITDSLAFLVVWRLSHLLVPFAFVMAIIKYRLFEIDLIIRATVVYSVLVFLLLGFYGGLAAGFSHLLFRRMGVTEAWGSILATLLVVGSAIPLRDRVRTWVDRRLAPRPRDANRVLQDLGSLQDRVPNLDAYLFSVVERVQTVLANRSVALFLRTDEDPVFRIRAAIGLPDEVIKKVKFEPIHPLVQVLQSSTVETLTGQPRAVQEPLRRVRASWLVPLWVRERMVGFLTLGRKISGEGFTGADRMFMTAVVEILGQGLQRLAERQRDQEYTEALAIQKQLLPREIPRLPGYQVAGAWQPARVVSGDYYDVLALDDDHVGLCIADVCGKGLPAALLMSNLQAAVRSVATATTMPDEVCRRVNELLYTNTEANKFVTFFYALLIGPERRLIFTNAGHPPPLLLHADGTVLQLSTHDPVLGVFPEWQYRSREQVLAPGDLMFLYTDGLLEARPRDRDEFGQARLIETLREYSWLSTDAFLHKIIQTVTAFTGGPLQDDLTLLVLRVRGV